METLKVIDYDGRDLQSFKKTFYHKFFIMKKIMRAVNKSLQANCIWKLMKCGIFAEKNLTFYVNPSW